MKNSRRHLMTFFIITTVAILFICSGCASTNRTAFFTKPVVVPEVVIYRPWTPNRSVCVLPFDNLSKDTDADIKVREILVTELFRAHIFKDIVDIVEANAALMSLRIRKPNSMDNETIKAIGERLGVDYLILGVLTEYGYGKANESGAEVGLSVRMIEIENGNILWTANNFKMGTNSLSRIFGISQGPSPMELSREVVEEIVSALSYEIAQQQRQRERAQKSRGGIMGIFGASGKKGEKSDYRR